MAIRQVAPNFRQNMLVTQLVGANTTVTAGDAYKVWASGTGATFTMTLPKANPGAGPFYFSAAGGNLTIQPQAGDNIIGFAAGVAITITSNAFIGLYCINTNQWLIVDSVDVAATILGIGNIGGIILVQKPALTSRNNSITPSNDPDLVVSIPGAGTYRIAWVIRASSTNVAPAPGINVNVNFSGTMTQNLSAGHFEGGGGAFQAFASLISATTTNTNFSSSLQTFDTPIYGESLLIATGSGTLALGWAQNVSSATPTVVDLGSWMIVTRIS